MNTSRLAAMNAKDRDATHYEEDHFISLELGATRAMRRTSGPSGGGTPAQPLTARGPFPPQLVSAKAEDAVENALHKAVCAGDLTLKEAQDIIATD